MRRKGISPDEASYSSVLHASASLAALDQGTLIHDQIIKTGFIKNECIASSLVTILQGSKDNGLKKQLALGEQYSGFGTTYKAPQQRQYYFIQEEEMTGCLKKVVAAGFGQQVQEIDSSGSLEDCRSKTRNKNSVNMQTSAS
nr:hypothetical protein CFP56_72904 [Quercus suber]